MKRCAPRLTGLFAFLGMAVLILDARTALSGAQEGVALCLRTVIPSLFPFFVLSAMLTGSLLGRRIPLLGWLGRLCKIPDGGESLLLTGLLGGYPVGAQAVAQAYRQGALSRADGERLLGFCSNAGPSFLFGMLMPLFPTQRAAWALWGVHILSALIVGALLPGKRRSSVVLTAAEPPSLSRALNQATHAMAGVCAWVVLFRVLLAVLNRWCFWLLPTPARLLLTGALELTNGCCALGDASGDALRFLLASMMLGFGGLCVGMQTASVTGELGMGLYWPGKVMQSVISLLLAATVQYALFPAQVCVRVPPVFLLLALPLLIFPFVWRKSSGKTRAAAL